MAEKIAPLSPEGRASFLDLYRAIITISTIRGLHTAGVFDAIQEPRSLDGISSVVNVNRDILERLLRPLVATGFVHYDGKYHNTPISSQYVQNGIAADLFNVACQFGLDIFASAGKWLTSATTNDPFTFHHNLNGRTGGTKFDIINNDPELLHCLHRGLSGWQAFHPLLGSYNFDSAIEQYKQDPATVFLVDIGGGNGAFVEEFLRAYPRISASETMIQDLPNVLELAIANQGLPSAVRLQPHDFFQPQPVLEARVYHIRACIHDWDDLTAVKILRNIAIAMHPTSILLIGDNVMSDEPSVDDVAVLTDILMLGVGGRERKGADFVEILEQAGLRLVRIHSSKEPSWCTIEARLK